MDAGVADTGHPHWYGLLAPAGLPAAELARLHAATLGTMQDTALWKSLVHEGATVETTSPPEFTRLLGEEHAAWGAVIRRIGLTIE